MREGLLGEATQVQLASRRVTDCWVTCSKNLRPGHYTYPYVVWGGVKKVELPPLLPPRSINTPPNYHIVA